MVALASAMAPAHRSAVNSRVTSNVMDLSNAMHSASSTSSPSADFTSVNGGFRVAESSTFAANRPRLVAPNGAKPSRVHRMGGTVIDMRTAPARAHLRRNGKVGSCEPCRAVKLRCDHELPTCGRCAKRGYTAKCVYVANPKYSRQALPKPTKPITNAPSCDGFLHFQQSRHPSLDLSVSPVKPFSPSNLNPVFPDAAPSPQSFTPINTGILHSLGTPIAQSPCSFPTSSDNTSSTNGFTFSTVEDPDLDNHVIPIPTASPRLQRCASAPPGDVHFHGDHVAVASLGYVGTTNFTSILTEGLDKLDGPEISSADLQPPKIGCGTIPNRLIIEGCDVLAFLKDWHMVTDFMRRMYEICDDSTGILIPAIMKEWLNKLRIFHSDALEKRNPEKLRRLSGLLWSNTQIPLQFNGKTSAIEWARLGTGNNIRWEVIGLIAVHIGFTATCLAPTNKLFHDHNVERESLVRRMAEITESCIYFCRKCQVMDDMFTWLLIEQGCLLCYVHGERSFERYRAVGEANDAVICMGLHQPAKDNGKIPFWLQQTRMGVMLYAHGIEIGIALFLGRPPRLSHRYCHLDRPLDLTESQVILEGPALQAALQSLDDQGFNTSNRIQRMTWVRTWSVFTALREDILDLSLGSYTLSEIHAKADAITARSDSYWASLPAFIQRTRSHPVDFLSLPVIDALYVHSFRQGTRTNELMLQRVLLRRAGASPEKLIRIARAIFADVLQITSRHDVAATMRADFSAILVNHGLRCGAILAVELLKQEQMAVYPRDSEALLPRSQTIQDLSVFAARLGGVDRGDGSYGACEQGRRMIGLILDRILGPPRRPEPVVLTRVQESQAVDVDMGLQTVVGGYETMAPAFSGENPLTFDNEDFMLWLDNVDFDSNDAWTTVCDAAASGYRVGRV